MPCDPQPSLPAPPAAACWPATPRCGECVPSTVAWLAGRGKTMSAREIWLSAHVAQQDHVPVGCSNSSTFSPTQPWRAETRLIPSKAAVNNHFLRGGWDDPNCARPRGAFSGRALREHGDRPSHPRSFFSIILDPLDPNGRNFHDTPQHRGIPDNAADHIDTVGRDRILPHTHRRASEENGQDLPGPPEGDIADFDVIRRRLSMVLHPGQLKIELFAPRVDRTFNR